MRVITAELFMTGVLKQILLRSFLNKISFSKETMLQVLDSKKNKTKLEGFLSERNFSFQKVNLFLMEVLSPLGDFSHLELIDVYDYVILKVDQDARDKHFNKADASFIEVFLLLYENFLQIPTNHVEDNFYDSHPFLFLTSEELKTLEDQEYLKFLKAFQDDHILTLMKMSKDLYGYNTLDHVAGVHDLGMYLARQLKQLNLPLDLGRCSGALAGHDIGKYGVKLSEMSRVPYFHYYYSDLWFKKHNINYIRNTAVNHSTWDLELENLSLESLVLIYADFRVKNKSLGSIETMYIYTLKESYQVILDKLDNMDEAKEMRYKKVYEKLNDFERYLKTLGVNVDLPINETKKKIFPKLKRNLLKNPSLCFGDEIKERLIYHAMDHNIKVMHLLRDEYSMETLLEEARSVSDWKDLREYIRIFEEYSTYLTKTQKRQVITFLTEQLIHPEDDIRYHSAEILGKLLGSFDEDYPKEIPPLERLPEEPMTGLKLLEDLLQRVLYPSHQVLVKQKSYLGYAYPTIIKNLFLSLPPHKRPPYLLILQEYYKFWGNKPQDVYIHLTEALKFIPFPLKEIESFLKLGLRGDLPLRLSVLEEITTYHKGQKYTVEFNGFLRNYLSENPELKPIVEVFYLMKISGQLMLIDERAQLQEILVRRSSEMNEIFLKNLKTATHWLEKRSHIKLLLYYSLSMDKVSPLNTALHFCNLLKVSAVESVRRQAGQGILVLMKTLTTYERNEVAVELLRALEIEGHGFTEYIPKPLGRVLLYLHPTEFDEITADLLHKVKTAHPAVKALILKTVGTTLEFMLAFNMRSITLTLDELQKKVKDLLRILLTGMADYENLAVRASFTTLGKVIFASPVLTKDYKKDLFILLEKKIITLLTEEKDSLLFLCQSVALNNIYRFITNAFLEKDPLLREPKKYAFFPGTFDPFTLSHLEMAKIVRDAGYEVYLAIDEFSWSKSTLPHKIRGKILEMSIAGEPSLYYFPDEIPINIGNEKDLETLKNLFPHSIHMVCGSDVVLNASSYKCIPKEHSIHSLNHLIFERSGGREVRTGIKSTLPNAIFLDLPHDLKEVSSTKIRNSIDENHDISTFIDAMAQNYIYHHGFYQKSPVEKIRMSKTFLEKVLYREINEEVKSMVKHLLPQDYADVLILMEETLTKDSGEILFLMDRSKDSVVGFSLYHWVKNEDFHRELRSLELCDELRNLNLGRTCLIDGLFVCPPDILRPYHRILMTETLALAVSKDYECALVLPKAPLLGDEKFISLLKYYNFDSFKSRPSLYYVDMSRPMTLSLDLTNILKPPFSYLPKVRTVLKETQRSLLMAICNLYPGKLLLSFEPLMLQQGMISLICQENSVPYVEEGKKELGHAMCVPYGDVLAQSIVPNTVTKTLHTEKYFPPSMKNFTIKEVPFYLSLPNQIKTLASFNRPLILVDTILHKGYRINALDPLLKENQVQVQKIISGIVSAKGMDLMKEKNYNVRGVYYIPRLKAWFNEKDLYPFIGGDGLWRGSFPKRNLINSITLTLPYTTPNFIMDSGGKNIYQLSLVAIENSLKIFTVIEEEFHKLYERKLTLNSLGQVFTMPRVPDPGENMIYDLNQSPSSYLRSDIEKLKRLEKLIR